MITYILGIFQFHHSIHHLLSTNKTPGSSLYPATISTTTTTIPSYLFSLSRRNKNGGQRIVVFVGSPIEADGKTLVKVGKDLKKNGVAVDVISMGEIEDNQQVIVVVLVLVV